MRDIVVSTDLSSYIPKAVSEMISGQKTVDVDQNSSDLDTVDLGEHFFVQNGTTFLIQDKTNSVIHKKLPGGNYAVKITQTGVFYLEKVADFKPPKKLYGDVHTRARKILNSFHNRAKNLGVLCAGEKGSGKTLLNREICRIAAEENDMPTIVIGAPYAGEGFFQFMYSIEQNCIVFIDEFEKVYGSDRVESNDNPTDPDAAINSFSGITVRSQQSLLTLLDGVYQSKKLFLLTCNDLSKIDSHLRNRPGRIHYLFNFPGLEIDFVREYCQDNLKDKSKVDEVTKLFSIMLKTNFDMLQALVWEMNLYNQGALEAMEYLNIKPDDSYSTKYNMTVTSSVICSNPNFVCAIPTQSYFTPVGSEGSNPPVRLKFIVGPRTNTEELTKTLISLGIKKSKISISEKDFSAEEIRAIQQDPSIYEELTEVNPVIRRKNPEPSDRLSSVIGAASVEGNEASEQNRTVNKENNSTRNNNKVIFYVVIVVVNPAISDIKNVDPKSGSISYELPQGFSWILEEAKATTYRFGAF